VCENKSVVAPKPFIVFDFHHAKLVLSSTIIVVKPITIKEDYFKLLIPNKVELKDIANDPIIVLSG
jgi:hypothetical protein